MCFGATEREEIQIEPKAAESKQSLSRNNQAAISSERVRAVRHCRHQFRTMRMWALGGCRALDSAADMALEYLDQCAGLQDRCSIPQRLGYLAFAELERRSASEAGRSKRIVCAWSVS